MFGRDGDRLYVVTTSLQGDSLKVIDARQARVIDSIPLGHRPTALMLAPNGGRLYVGTANQGVQVVELPAGRIQSIAVDGAVSDLALTPDGRWLYAALETAGLRKIDTASNAVTVVPTTACPEKLAITPDGQQLYVNYQCGGPGGRNGHDTIDAFAIPGERLLGSVTDIPNVGSAIVASPNGAQVWAFRGGCLRQSTL